MILWKGKDEFVRCIHDAPDAAQNMEVQIAFQLFRRGKAVGKMRSKVGF